MNNKPNHECVSNKIIINNWNALANVFLKIINTSLETGIFPENGKNDTPIIKVPKKKKCEEFRPIITFKVCEKIMEKVVKIQL